MLCADDGKEIVTKPEAGPDSHSSGYPITDEKETLLNQVTQDSYPTIPVVENRDECLELCYIVRTAKFAYQPDGGGRPVAPLLPREGVHLCVHIFAATGATHTVVQRDDALLAPEEVQKNRPSVMAAIKQ